MAAGAIPYEDKRLTHDQWATEKPNTPFGQAPVLEVDSHRFAQSIAIATYLAREANLYGKNSLEGLQIDQVINLGADFLNAAVKAFFEKDEAQKAELLKNVKEVEAPKYLAFFEKLLKESGTGFFVGNSITFADIFVYDLCYNFGQRKMLATDGHPLVEALIKKVESHDKIKAYLATRKPTEN
jgi:glutathione S-transferase